MNIEGTKIDADLYSGEVRYHLKRKTQEIGGSAASLTLQQKRERWVLILPGEILGHDQPCNMDNYRTQGKNRPHPAGSSVHGTDGALVTIKDIDPSAWDRLLQENEFNDPPVRGQMILILRVEAANTHGAGGIDVDERYFELSGSGGNVYKTFKTPAGSIQTP